jgi:hypothetical protein
VRVLCEKKQKDIGFIVHLFFLLLSNTRPKHVSMYIRRKTLKFNLTFYEMVKINLSIRVPSISK